MTSYPFLNQALLMIVTIWTFCPNPVLAQENQYKWTDVQSLDMEGRGWEKEPDFFGRLPAKAEGKVPSSVWSLSKHTSGMVLRFKTDATSMKVKWALTNERLAMPHFAATGVSGVDLYVKTEKGDWHWLAVGQPRDFPENETVFFEGVAPEEREFLLYLPLYNGVESLLIGLPEEAVIKQEQAPSPKPIVFYGTSITQGGCASRAGMSATAILGRNLGTEVINLGFSGSGKMEPELAHLLAELDPSIYFLDCLPNLTAQEVSERVEPFVRILREKHPTTPIVLAEGVTYNNSFFIESRNQRSAESRKALHDAYESLLREGFKNIYYQIGEGQLGFDGEGTVDGSHPTDLGFWRQAKVYQPLIESVLEKEYGI